jgi:hypothetical protein
LFFFFRVIAESYPFMRSMFLLTWMIPIKKTFIVSHIVFLVFLNMVAGDLHTLVAVFVSPPERLREVHHRKISHTPSCFF